MTKKETVSLTLDMPKGIYDTLAMAAKHNRESIEQELINHMRCSLSNELDHIFGTMSSPGWQKYARKLEARCSV